jgi:hypothetical protein
MSLLTAWFCVDEVALNTFDKTERSLKLRASQTALKTFGMNVS